MTTRLIDIIEANHRVIEANTFAVSQLMNTLHTMQETLQLLVTQITTSISQRNEAVPVKVVLLIVGIMAAIIAVVVGLDIGQVKAIVP